MRTRPAHAALLGTLLATTLSVASLLAPAAHAEEVTEVLQTPGVH